MEGCGTSNRRRQLGYLVLLALLAVSNIVLGIEYIGVLLPTVLITSIPGTWIIVLDSNQSTVYLGDIAVYIATGALLVALLLRQWDKIVECETAESNSS